MDRVSAMVQKIPLVETFFCGLVSLRTGTLVIATADAVFNACQLIVASILASVVQRLKDLIVGSGIPAPIITGFYGLTVFLALYSVIVIALCAMVVVGIRRGSRKLLIPWLCGTIPRILVVLIFSIAMIARAEDYARVISASHYVNNFDVDAGFASYVSAAPLSVQGIANLITVPFLIYFFFVVYSCYGDTENHGSVRHMRPWKAPPAPKEETRPEVSIGKAAAANSHRQDHS